MAKGLAEAGATVYLNARVQANVDRALDALSEDGLVARASVFDICDRDRAASELDRIEREHASLDILINNVGMRDRRHPDEVEWDAFQTLLETNLTAAFALARHVTHGMRIRKWGRIINMSALAASTGIDNAPSYAASKGGLEALTRTMAATYGPHGITVNAISPGFFATQTNAAMVADPTLGQKLAGRTSLQRWGEPSEIAGAAVFLASDAASYITGQTIMVDGGCVGHF
jgi:gluconate 5-dehydrogenase